MNAFLKFLRLEFLPQSTDVGLLVLRLWLGVSLLVLHGWTKLANFAQMSGKFADPLGIGTSTSLSLAVFGEVVASLFLALGLFTRFAALSSAAVMSVAFFLVHQGVLKGPKGGELAFIYLAGYVALLIAGGGRFSLDAKLGKPAKTPSARKD
jgi:putative oxidoreductase